MGVIGGGWIHAGSPWGTLCSSGVVGLTLFLHWCRWVHPGSLGSLGFALGVFGFIRVPWIHSGAPLG